MTWKFPFSSGVPIGYCLHNCLVIGWFKCLQNHQINLGTRVFIWSWPGVTWFRLCLVTVLWLVLWPCWRFNDVVFRISWLNNAFWLAATSFEFVLAVSGLWTFQHACFLYRNKVVAGNLPVTPVTSLRHHVGEVFSERGPIFLNYVRYF